MSLSASTRKDIGKGPARQYKKNGKVPGVVYGNKIEPTPIIIELAALKKYIKDFGTSRMLSLSVDGTDKIVLFKTIDRNPITEIPFHVDFLEIDQSKEVERTASLTFVGVPVGVAVQGGMLSILNREIEITCLPKDIPEKAIVVDIQNLELNHNMHASDIILPANVTLSSSSDMPLVSISLPKEEKVVAAPEEGAEDVAETSTDEKKEPELVDQKGKKEEE